MESYFLSDIHLKSVSERNGQILLRFLHSLKNKNPKDIQLFLLGDIFDLWVSNGNAFVKKYQEIVDVIGELTKSGVKVYFFEGNHDLHIHPYWKDILNVEVFVEAQYFDIDYLKIRLEHGDLINQDDIAYLRLRRTLRSQFVEDLGHLVPGGFWLWFGNQWSPISRKKSGEYRSRNEKKLVKMIRDHAKRAYMEKPFDLIITGHMHVRDDFQISEKSRSINLGSWFEDVKILKIHQGKIEWIPLDAE